MRRRRSLLAVFLAAVLLNCPTAFACGPFTLEAVFVHTVHPTFPLERFAGGRIGVVQPSYARSYLFVTYRYLSGLSFSTAEQRALVGLWKNRLEFSPDLNPEDWSKGWLAARQKVPGVPERDAIDVYRSREKPNEYETFVNCNKDSFETAIVTLNERITKYGADNSAIKFWIEGQDQVFANCSGGRNIPSPAPSNADALMRADRTYQIAAANFYSSNFEEARKDFEAISVDTTSPWQRVAPYLIARTLIRKASLGPSEQKQESLRHAESQLAKILADNKLAHLHAAATRLNNLVRLRLHPDQRLHELAQTLLAKNQNANLKQDLWDYTVLLDGYLEVDETKPRDALKGDDLSDWIATFQSPNLAALDHSLARWQATRADTWLIAALSKVDSKHPRAGELIAQALNVKTNAAAYASARFHAVRLLMESGKNDEARTLVEQLLKTNRAPFDESSLNLLTSKRLLLAINLNDFLAHAPRIPVALSWNDDGREIPAGDDEVSAEMKAVKDKARFDYDGGNALNRQFPLARLKEAATSTALPAPLRRDVAQAAWLRAAMLGDTKTADELVPVLSALVPELSSLLNAYLTATTPSAKKFSAIYAWLKFPGLEPIVDIGIGRQTPLSQQDTYRDNWWCGAAFQPTQGENEEEGPTSFTARNTQPLLFVSPVEKTTAAREWATLNAAGAAPNYISSEVIQWATKTPNDPRVPEALHLAVNTTRFGCTDKETGRWSKSAFDLLHRKYPNTSWARKTKYWFKD
jgi:tetratricopeptide (TPR) repeat protein